jgi:TRAP-type mannitol/chloroaromatic compound transport system substrate-binding protein
MTERRTFIAAASGVAAAAVAALVDAPNVIAQPKVQWRMPTTVPAALDIQFGAAQRLAKAVEEMSGGRFRIEVFPAGQIMPAFACFDAASQGKVEMFCAGSIFWDTKDLAERLATLNPESVGSR